jgi:HlyD family secretion protein
MAIHIPRQVWFAVVGVAMLLALAWVATKSGPLAPTRVTVAPVIVGDVAPALFGIGTVDAQRAYLIGPTTAGRVRRVLVDVGDTVTAGQLIAEMDPVDLDSRVTSTVAAAARGRSAEATAEAQLRDARSRRELASTEARRYLELGRKGVVAQSVVDAAQQTQQSTEAQVAAAEAALAGARKDLARLDADLGGAEQQRANIRLFAPVNGVVTSRDAEPGSTVIAGQPVLKLHDPRSVWVTVRLDQGRSSGLVVGLRSDVTLRSDPRRTHAGAVVRVEPTSDSVTEERLARVAFDRIPPGVSTGEMAEVTLHLPTISHVITISNASLRYRGPQSGVWLHADGHLRFVPVTTGAEDLDGRVQILDGLREGDEVVVYSERDLTDTSRITVVTSLTGNAK